MYALTDQLSIYLGDVKERHHASFIIKKNLEIVSQCFLSPVNKEISVAFSQTLFHQYALQICTILCIVHCTIAQTFNHRTGFEEPESLQCTSG